MQRVGFVLVVGICAIVWAETPETQPPTRAETSPKAAPRNANDVVGFDPMTLMPQGFDFSHIFPAYEVSSELVLKPTLAYAADGLSTSLGELGYGDPKRWVSHFGELVRVVSASNDMPNPAEAIYENRFFFKEVRTVFCNAQGQEVAFYPLQRIR